MTQKAFSKPRKAIATDSDMVLREVFTTKATFEVQCFRGAQREGFMVLREEGSSDAGISVKGCWNLIYFLGRLRTREGKSKKKEKRKRER